MKLAIPCFVEDRIYTEYEFRKPKGSTLADTNDVLSRDGSFQAITEFLSGCIKEFTSTDGSTETRQTEIKKIVKAMPYQSAEDAALKIMAAVNPNDKIEGVYACPRCNQQIITGRDDRTGEDTRETIEGLPVKYLELNEKQEFEEIIYIDLEDPITIKDSRTDQVIDEILEIGLKWPTLQDCINGTKRYPTEDTKRQYAIYVSALASVNSEARAAAYKATWGMFIFNEMSSADLKKVSAIMRKYGISKTIERQCPKCGRIWEAPVNTAGFFASGLSSD
jgi:hypothetical protein